MTVGTTITMTESEVRQALLEWLDRNTDADWRAADRSEAKITLANSRDPLGANNIPAAYVAHSRLVEPSGPYR